MNVIILYGSPRKKGNTAIILDEIDALFSHLKIKTEKIYLEDLMGYSCKGCNFCKKNARCIFQDDYSLVIEKIIKSELVVIGSPVYFGGVTSQLKIVIDRLQYIYNNSNKIKKNINILCVSTAAEANEEVFEGIKLTLKYLKYIFKSVRCEFIGITKVEEALPFEKLMNRNILTEKISLFLNRT